MYTIVFVKPGVYRIMENRLIAAAPELLAALEWLLDGMETLQRRNLAPQHLNMVTAARAAIAKARGHE